MAIKRMFDKTIIDTDSFTDLPMTAKAIYFLLGMEADDEGFVSPKRVLRLYGGSDDDIKVLIAKNFLIPFESGVVVITHWKSNNYLDKNRIKPTQYQKELEKLTINKSGLYIITPMLNKRLTDVQPEEYRGEERSTEENSIEEKKKFFLFNKNTQREENTMQFSTDREAQQWATKNAKKIGDDYFALEVRTK